MRRFLRYLRIAFSATCLIACMLLIVLWVRSYWKMDILDVPLHRWQVVFGSYHGYALATFDGFETDDRDWNMRSYGPTWFPEFPTRFRFGIQRVPTFVYVEGPYWVCVLVAATIGILAALPWIRWRFSLRSLLIATTLVAVVLGVIVWLQ